MIVIAFDRKLRETLQFHQFTTTATNIHLNLLKNAPPPGRASFFVIFREGMFHEAFHPSPLFTARPVPRGIARSSGRRRRVRYLSIWSSLLQVAVALAITEREPVGEV